MEPKILSELYHTTGTVMLWYDEGGVQKYKLIEPADCSDKWHRYKNQWSNKNIHMPETEHNPPTPFL